MPDTGTPWNIPYPSAIDPPDDPTQSQARALQLHADFDKVAGPTVAFTPTWTGLTLGNGTAPMNYRLLGTHAVVYLEVRAAASAPTTAFIAGECSFTVPWTTSRRATGVVYFETAVGSRAGMVMTQAGVSTVLVRALRQTDVTYNTPAIVWGTAAWAVGDRAFGQIVIPI